MLIRVISVLLVCAIAAPAVAQQSRPPLNLQALNIVTQPAQIVAASGRSGMKNPAAFWLGVTLVAGGATMAILSATTLKTEVCVATGTYYAIGVACEQEMNNTMLYAGLGVLGAGGILSAFSASVTDRTVAIRYTKDF